MKLGTTILLTAIIILLLLFALLLIDRVLTSYFGPEVTGVVKDPSQSADAARITCTNDCNLSCSSLESDQRVQCLDFCVSLCADGGQ